MDAVKLYNKYSIEELQAMEKKIKEDPRNQLTGQFYLYTPSARKKLDAIAWAITYHLKDARIAKGEFIREDGYAGKKRN